MTSSLGGFQRVQLDGKAAKASLGLFREVKNADQLRRGILAGTLVDGGQGKDVRLDVSLVKAGLVLCPTQAAVAANKAAVARRRDRMTTRSLGAEVVFNLATGSKNITESLAKFGVGDADADLLAVVVAEGEAAESVEAALASAESSLSSSVEGRLAVDLTTELAEASSDLEAAARAHRLKPAEASHGRDMLASLLVSRCACKDI